MFRLKKLKILTDFKQFGLLFLVSIVLIVLGKVGFLNPVINLTQVITVPIQQAFYQTYRNVENTAETIVQIGSLRKENSKLKIENVSLKSENANLKKLEAENSSLRKQLNTPLPKISVKLVANTIGQGAFGSKKVLLINKGSKQKVKIGNLVVVENILIGEVINTSPNSSSVQLLNDPATKIPAITVGGAEGIAEGEFGSSLSLTNVEQNESLKSGELVFTSGKNDYPQNLVIGEIDKVNKIEKEFFQRASVKPLIELKELKLVYIIEKI